MHDWRSELRAQRLTRREAFEICTRNGARMGFEGADKGSVELGKLGNLVVLSGSPGRAPGGDPRRFR